jgi:hypothetical protein
MKHKIAGVFTIANSPNAAEESPCGMNSLAMETGLTRESSRLACFGFLPAQHYICKG